MVADGISGDFTAVELLRRWDDLTRCLGSDVADDVRLEMAAAPWGRQAAASGGAVNERWPRKAEAVAVDPWPRTGRDRRVASYMASRS